METLHLLAALAGLGAIVVAVVAGLAFVLRWFERPDEREPKCTCAKSPWRDVEEFKRKDSAP